MKVLSIDVDYCFPAIEKWPNENGELWDEWHAFTKWENYFKTYPDLNCREEIVDEKCFDYMVETFTKALYANPNATVAFGLDHDYILEELLDKEDLEIVNIDHHDDFLAGAYLDQLTNHDKSGKNDDDDDEDTWLQFLSCHLIEYHYAKTYGKVDEGSWGGYLHALGKLKAMTWIHNNDKDEYDTRSIVNRFICNNVGKYADWGFATAEEYDHGNYEYDHIFVCLSPQYFPHSQWDIFSVFLGIYEDFTGKDCKLDEFWYKRTINTMAYRNVYDTLKPALEDIKRSLAK